MNCPHESCVEKEVKRNAKASLFSSIREKSISEAGKEKSDDPKYAHDKSIFCLPELPLRGAPYYSLADSSPIVRKSMHNASQCRTVVSPSFTFQREYTSLHAMAIQCSPFTVSSRMTGMEGHTTELDVSPLSPGRGRHPALSFLLCRQPLPFSTLVFSLYTEEDDPAVPPRTWDSTLQAPLALLGLPPLPPSLSPPPLFSTIPLPMHEYNIRGTSSPCDVCWSKRGVHQWEAQRRGVSSVARTIFPDGESPSPLPPSGSPFRRGCYGRYLTRYATSCASSSFSPSLEKPERRCKHDDDSDDFSLGSGSSYESSCCFLPEEASWMRVTVSPTTPSCDSLRGTLICSPILSFSTILSERLSTSFSNGGTRNAPCGEHQNEKGSNAASEEKEEDAKEEEARSLLKKSSFTISPAATPPLFPLPLHLDICTPT